MINYTEKITLLMQDVVARVKPGMTKAEVRQILGTPLLADVFHANRWDYYFRSEKRGQLVEQNRFSVFFENERVTRVEGGPTLSAAGTAPKK